MESLGLLSGKVVLKMLNFMNKSGTALPGKIALKLDKNILKTIDNRADKIIFVTGTNGKTTSNNLLYHILSQNNVVLSNLRGANMIQGIVSSYIRNTKKFYNYAIFEVDEGSIPELTKMIKPDYVLITNFFRDQLDRFGELEETVDCVYDNLENPETTLILNVDDPYVNMFSKKNFKTVKFGMLAQHSLDENNVLLLNNCPICGGKLNYYKYNYGHLGNYSCSDCGLNNEDKDYNITNINQREDYQLITIEFDDIIKTIKFNYIGQYNAYNVCGVFALCKTLGIDDNHIINNINDFNFSLGRMQDIHYKDKIIRLILTKNPTGFTESINIISDNKEKKVIVQILNDNGADGRDTSWIWDASINFNNIETINKYYCSGIRAEDMALRIKYSDFKTDKIIINSDWQKTLDESIEEDVDIIYVLPTYTAIFETKDYLEKLTS